MARRFFIRSAIARLAVCLLVFAGLQAGFGTSMAHGARIFVDLSASTAGATAPHDHTTTICHSCDGHICLEQHGAVDQTASPPAVLPTAVMTIEPWPSSEAWAHPPTAPPRARFVDFIPLPRAPPAAI